MRLAAVLFLLAALLSPLPPASAAPEGGCISRSEWRAVYQGSDKAQSRRVVQRIVGTKATRDEEWTPSNRVYYFPMCGDIVGRLTFFFSNKETRWRAMMKQWEPPLRNWSRYG